ncbi:MAG TPA: transposase family protein [Planctomycetaceae bacterium]|nr:transposase family protein [Planctomycetaceae bacterium]
MKTGHVPWAEPHGHYTLLFEAFAVQVLQAAATGEKGH